MTTFPTAWGEMSVAWSRRGLCQTVLPGISPAQQRQLITFLYPQVHRSEPEEVRTAIKELQAYFRGEMVVFSFPLDLSWATPFQREVYFHLEQIRWGETRSYGQVAAALGRPEAARAVAGAAARNRLPVIIPCHRLVRADGSRGGFSAPGRGKMKKRLLAWEQKVMRRCNLLLKEVSFKE